MRLLKVRMKRTSDRSLYYFTKYVLGFREVSLQPHWDLCRFIERHQMDNTVTLMPRGVFKSSVISVSFPLWLLTKNRDLRILLSSADLTNSKNFLGLIKDHLEKNERFRLLYGDWIDKKSNTWTNTAISVSGRKRLRAEDTITASSYEVPKVSQHYDIAIMDDLQNYSNVRSKEMIDAVQDYLRLVVPLLDPIRDSVGRSTGRHGPLHVVGTRWHMHDVYGRTKRQELEDRRKHNRKRWFFYVKKAGEIDPVTLQVKDNDKLLFPSQFSAEALNELASNMTWYQFSCQYLNDPQPDATKKFQLNRLGFFDGTNRVLRGEITQVPAMRNHFIVLDPSASKTATSDFVAFTTVSVDSDWNIYLQEINRARMSEDEVLDQIFRLYNSYRPMRFGIEAISFSKMYQWAFTQRCRDVGQYFHLQELKTDNQKTKEMRISGFAPYVNKGGVFLKVKPGTDLTQDYREMYYDLLPGHEVLWDEMDQFPLGSSDDVLDSLAYQPQLIFPERRPTPKKEIKEQSFEKLFPQLFQKPGRTKISLR